MSVLAHSYVCWIALILGLLAVYILPSVIAAIRGVPGLGWIIVLNLLPTGIGWLAALIAALALPRREPCMASFGLPQSRVAQPGGLSRRASTTGCEASFADRHAAAQ